MLRGKKQKHALFAFLLFFVATLATPALGNNISDNISAANESMDKYSPEFRIPATGEGTLIKSTEKEGSENHSQEFNLTRVEGSTGEGDVQKGEAYSIQHGLINYSDPQELEKYSPEYNITAVDGNYKQKNEEIPIDSIEDTSPKYNLTASSVFVGFFENLIDRFKFW